MSLRTLGHSTPEQYSKSTSLVLQQSLCIQLHWPASPLEPGSYLSVSDSKQFVCFLAVFKVCCALESPGDVPGLGPAGILVYGFCFMVWTGADSLFGSFVLQYWGLSLGHCTSYATTPLSQVTFTSYLWIRFHYVIQDSLKLILYPGQVTISVSPIGRIAGLGCLVSNCLYIEHIPRGCCSL